MKLNVYIFLKLNADTSVKCELNHVLIRYIKRLNISVLVPLSSSNTRSMTSRLNKGYMLIGSWSDDHNCQVSANL